MSTAWYVADKDGNVGIIAFNENGPVPWGVEQTCIEDLVYGYMENCKKKMFLPIALTDSQIDDLMELPHLPKDEESWLDCIVEIDTKKEREFLRLSKKRRFEIEQCISRERGLYCISVFHDFDDEIPYAHAKPLRKMLKKEIIKTVYNKKWFDIEEICEDDGKVTYKKYFSKSPYFIFYQPYNTALLPQCIEMPDNPVKLDQFPAELRRRVLQLPVEFKKDNTFQIAEWYPCTSMCTVDDTITIGGHEYCLLPKPDGTMAYFITELISDSNFFNYCTEKKKNKCNECNFISKCTTVEIHCFTNKPTVIIVAHPYIKMDYTIKTKADIIMEHSIWLPVVPKIPSNISFGDCKKKKCKKKSSKHKPFCIFLDENKKWFEDIISRFNPRVIIVSDEMKMFMKMMYDMDNNLIINGIEYPYYLLSEVEANRKKIEKFAMLSYQGDDIPLVISVDEGKNQKKT